MSKPPEEGQIWEWRAFGKLGPRVMAAVVEMPIRNGIRDVPTTDIYLIAPVNEQNVKLRLNPKGWILKFKLLLLKHHGGIELYHETARWTFPFPIAAATLREAGRLLDVLLDDKVLTLGPYTKDAAIEVLTAASAVVSVETRKVRSQYVFDDGWIEIADVDYGARQIQSLSIHSPHIEGVQQMLDQLQPDNGLTVMNYVEACRRFR